MISDLTGAYLLEPDPAGGTRVTYELAVGLIGFMPGFVKKRAEKSIIDTALKGLRGRARQVAGENGGS
jgi:hypothetical protein